MAPQTPELNIFLLPLMAPGHMNPMLDTAKLFADRGLNATLLTTPSNAPLLRTAVSGHRQLSVLTLNFPSGLDTLASPEISPEFVTALQLLCRRTLRRTLESHRPDCIVFDSFLPWVSDVALRLRIPGIVFHGFGFFPLCVSESLRRLVGQVEAARDDELVLVPGLPHRVEMRASRLPETVRARTGFSEFMDRMAEAEGKSYGAVVNSFYEMEPDCVDHYRNVLGREAWHIGPVSLRNETDRGSPLSAEQLSRASSTSRKASETAALSITSWLDSKPRDSVVYVCFGSLCRLTAAQMAEISSGLTVAGHPFIYVVRDEESAVKEEGEGLVVRGWAPQRAILAHKAVGGFVTHCGWNSVMEAASAGVPMVTWPMFAEQFYNEAAVVEVMGIGTRVGAEVWGMREEGKPLVGAAEIARAVGRVMDGGEEAAEMRRRAAALGEKARRAVEEGGSSYVEIGRLIDGIREWKGKMIEEGFGAPD